MWLPRTKSCTLFSQWSVFAQGVVVYFRVVDGSLRKGDTIKLMNTRKEYEVTEVGVLAPKQVEVRTTLEPHAMPSIHGWGGYFAAGAAQHVATSLPLDLPDHGHSHTMEQPMPSLYHLMYCTYTIHNPCCALFVSINPQRSFLFPPLSMYPSKYNTG